MNISQKLKEMMENKKISRSRLARELGVHTSTVSNWLEGKEPLSRHLTAICDYFGCSTDYLLGHTDKKEKLNADIGVELTGEIADMLKLFRTASPEVRAAALAMLEAAERVRMNRDYEEEDR